MSETKSQPFNLFQPVTVTKLEDFGDFVQVTLMDVADYQIVVDVSNEIGKKFVIGEPIEITIVGLGKEQ